MLMYRVDLGQRRIWSLQSTPIYADHVTGMIHMMMISLSALWSIYQLFLLVALTASIFDFHKQMLQNYINLCHLHRLGARPLMIGCHAWFLIAFDWILNQSGGDITAGIYIIHDAAHLQPPVQISTAFELQVVASICYLLKASLLLWKGVLGRF